MGAPKYDASIEYWRGTFKVMGVLGIILFALQLDGIWWINFGCSWKNVSLIALPKATRRLNLAFGGALRVAGSIRKWDGVMKLTVAEVTILVVGAVVVAPVVAALLTPTPDAINMGLMWLAVVVVFVVGFFVVRRFVRRG
jgi:hypothetical protein